MPCTLSPSSIQESGILLSKPWTDESDTKGKAVSFLGTSVCLAQLCVALFMGPLINTFGTLNVVMVAAAVGVVLAMISCCYVVTKDVPRGAPLPNVPTRMFSFFTSRLRLNHESNL